MIKVILLSSMMAVFTILNIGLQIPAAINSNIFPTSLIVIWVILSFVVNMEILVYGFKIIAFWLRKYL